MVVEVHSRSTSTMLIKVYEAFTLKKSDGECEKKRVTNKH